MAFNGIVLNLNRIATQQDVTVAQYRKRVDLNLKFGQCRDWEIDDVANC